MGENKSPNKILKELAKKSIDDSFDYYLESKLQGQTPLYFNNIIGVPNECFLIDAYNALILNNNKFLSFSKIFKRQIDGYGNEASIKINEKNIIYSYYDISFLLLVTQNRNFLIINAVIINSPEEEIAIADYAVHYFESNNLTAKYMKNPIIWFLKTDKVTSSWYKTSNGIMFASIGDLLTLIYPSEQCRALTKKISETFETLNNLSNMSVSELSKFNYERFCYVVLNHVLDESKNDFTATEKEKIINYLYSCDYSKQVIKMFYTFLFAYSIFKEKHDDKYDFFDLTFITVSIFKCNEVIFNNLLNQRWPNISIIDMKKNRIPLGARDLSLGEMNQIFYTEDNRIKTVLQQNKSRSIELGIKLGKWIKYVRNGFLHKDILEEDDSVNLTVSISESICVMGLLIIVLGKEDKKFS